MQNEKRSENMAVQKKQISNELLSGVYACRDFVFDPIEYHATVYTFGRRKQGLLPFRMEDMNERKTNS